MKQLLDFFPVLAFFLTYFWNKDFILATYVLIGCSFLQIALTWLLWRKVERAHLITFIVLLIMGGLTIAFDNALFLKWKPSVVYWIFAVAILGSEFVGAKSLVRRMVESMAKNMPDTTLNLPDGKWKLLSASWILFCIGIGFINIYVAYQYTESTWVSFKLFGLTGLNIAFFIAQFFYLSRYISEEKPSDAGHSQAASSQPDESQPAPDKPPQSSEKLNGE